MQPPQGSPVVHRVGSGDSPCLWAGPTVVKPFDQERHAERIDGEDGEAVQSGLSALNQLLLGNAGDREGSRPGIEGEHVEVDRRTVNVAAQRAM